MNCIRNGFVNSLAPSVSLGLFIGAVRLLPATRCFQFNNRFVCIVVLIFNVLKNGFLRFFERKKNSRREKTSKWDEVRAR